MFADGKAFKEIFIAIEKHSFSFTILIHDQKRKLDLIPTQPVSKVVWREASVSAAMTPDVKSDIFKTFVCLLPATGRVPVWVNGLLRRRSAH